MTARGAAGIAPIVRLLRLKYLGETHGILSCDWRAGFIGSHLVDGLLARGHQVRVLDNFSTGNPANLAAVSHRIEMIEGDLTDLETVRRAARDIEVVFHQGALAAVQRSITDPAATHAVCATGTLHVLLAAREMGVRRVVYAASSSAYRALERLPKRETDPTLPLSPYAVAKLAGEQYCAAFTNVYGLETVRLRYFNVYGPKQSPDSAYAAVIPLFFKAMLEGNRPTIHGDGEQSRDFTYVSDVVRAEPPRGRGPRRFGESLQHCLQSPHFLAGVDRAHQSLAGHLDRTDPWPRSARRRPPQSG